MNESKRAKIRRILREPHASVRMDLPPTSTSSGLLGSVQHALKSRPRLYEALVTLFSPVWPSREYRRRIDQLMAAYGPGHVVLNLGSGPGNFKGREDFINIDLFALDRVDIQADVHCLPLEDGCADLALNIAMLEHVAAPQSVVAEMNRVLKPGGKALVFLPFMQPFHGAPDDYQRWTLTGAQALFQDFAHVEVGIGAGPVSGWLWLTIELLTLALSFGNATLKDLLTLILMPFLSPIKHLDLLFVRHPKASLLASGFYVLATK